MGKKYLNTKEDSIEQSILDVWQEAADMHAEGMDGRTKEYRSHRGKLESNRVKRENKKSSVKTEQPETLDGSGEHAYEVGTDRYAEYTTKITPGQNEASGKKEEVREENMTENRNLVNTIKNLWIEAAAAAVDPKEREELDSSPGDTAKKMKRAKEPTPGVSEEVELIEKSAKYLEIEFKDSTTAANAYKHINTKIARGGRQPWDDFNQEGSSIQFENMKDADSLMKELSRKFKFKVYEREELGEGTKEEYQKFFNAAMKKFKINSPSDLKSDEEKKKFFDYVDKNYTGEKDEENIEEKIELAKEFKVSSMRHALEQVWNVAEGELPPALKKAIAAKKDKEKKEDHDDDDENGKTLTGKKTAKIDIDPDLVAKK